MKNYLKRLLKNEECKLKSVYNKNDFDAINRNITELKLMINNLNKSQITNYKYLIMGSNTFVNKEFYEFIKNIIYLFSKIPLLETESSTRYPILKTIKSLDNNALFAFWNRIYDLETSNDPNKIINSSNTIIFDKTKKLNLNKGKCLVYKDSFTTKNYILFEKYNNVRDYIVPCSKSIELVSPFDNYNYINASVILSSYLYNKALRELKNSSMYEESKKLELIQIDNLAYEAKYLNKIIKDQDYYDLNDYIKGRLLYFIDIVIGLDCSINNSINLNDIINKAKDNTSDILNGFRKDENTIINTFKGLIKK